jgi:hypothetical protein
VEGLLIGAYAMLDGQSTGAGIFAMSWASSGMNWIYGSVGADESHKGSEAGDQPEINQIERHEPTPTNGYFDTKWYALYEGIARANTTLRIMAVATDISADDVKRITGEARFLRGYYHFEAKKMWNKVPYVDETKVTTDPANFKLGNEADIWPQITADLQFAYDNLPATMNAKGRANKWAAGAMLGKALLFQKKYAEARTLLDAVYTQGVNAQGQKYALLTAYQDNFNAETKNSTESVFAIQYSVNDGAPDAANGGWGEVLNYPHNSGPGGCCGFFQPTQDLVNSYQVDAVTGLPRLGNHNSVEVPSDMGIPASSVWSATGDYKKDGFVSAFEASSPNRERVYKALQDNKGVNPLTSPNTWQLVWVEPNDVAVDSRLDWSVGRRGIPYLDHGNHPGQAWIRDQPNGGPYSPKKNVFYARQKGNLTDKAFWTSGVTANNYTIIRFADVMLMLAEAEIETGTLARALTLVNLVRERAANSASMVKDANGSMAANYKVGVYPAFTSQEMARNAVQFERKLELAMEGHRFFDLVRYGTADPVMDAYYLYEGTQAVNKRTYLAGAKFDAGVDEYYPIPQRQIDLSGGALKQNPGY